MIASSTPIGGMRHWPDFDMQAHAKILRTAAIATMAVITLVVAGRLITRDLAPANPGTTVPPVALSQPPVTTAAPASEPLPRPRHGRLMVTPAARTGWLTYVDKVDRVTVTIPASWSAKPDPIPRLVYPDPVLAVGSWLFRTNRRDSCAPAGILRTLPADGALLWLIESRPTTDTSLFDPSGFGPRPRSFDLQAMRQRTIFCTHQRGLAVGWREAGRYFSVQIVLGPKAPSSRREVVQQVLQSIRPT
jgi:hypothetical protein